VNEPLFREEALDAKARRGGSGDLLRTSSVWIDRLHWVLLALVVLSAVLAWVVEVDGRRLIDILLVGAGAA